MPNIVDTLKERGLLSQLSDPSLGDKFEKPMVLYAGFDPTADSLHIGHLLQIMVLSQFQQHGHKPIALVGGATAMIGDPSGKSEERVLLNTETIEKNVNGIRGQLAQILDFEKEDNPAQLVNNSDWMNKFSYIDFLRDVGKNFRIGEMMGKESVRKRLNSDAGMSFTEFSYQLLQSYDFHHLHKSHNCILQIGGDDQWGNITAGIDLNRKMGGTQVYGLTTPLVTKADGQKFGKTEGGAVWLNSDKTTPYEFFQYFLNVDDRDVIQLLKYFTFMHISDIDALEKLVETEPERRQAQKVLANKVTKLVHGQYALEMVQTATKVLFGESISGLSDEDLSGIFSEVPSTQFDRTVLEEGFPLMDALVKSKLCQSRGDAKRALKQGSIYLNNNRISQIDYILTEASLCSESITVLRSGKKKYHLLRFN
jgi:tyrosyl-tRNA synthetase